MNTFSKTLSPAIRISYMVLPEKLLRIYINSANFFSNTSSNLEQQILARFIRGGYFQRHINRMRKYYQAHGEMFRKVILSTAGIPVESVSEVLTGTHLLVKLKTGLSDKEVKLRARMKGINIGCLSDFCIGDMEPYRHTLVLNYPNMSEAGLRHVMEELGKIF